jgi:hypothetical protein
MGDLLTIHGQGRAAAEVLHLVHGCFWVNVAVIDGHFARALRAVGYDGLEEVRIFGAGAVDRPLRDKLGL